MRSTQAPRWWWVLVAVSLPWLAHGCRTQPETAGGPRRPPNIVYILADDMGYGDVSCLNEAAAWETPHMDRVAAEGMTFADVAPTPK